jgi:hypothetical protein
MRHFHAPAVALFPFLLSLGGCGSDSGSGGCQNLSGTYHATTMSCASSGGDTKVVQTGCSATVTIGQGDTLTGTVAGNKFTSPDVSCTVVISGTSYITDCTQKDAAGKPVTCHETGDVADRPAQSGAGGAGPGAGGSGNTTTGGAANGSSGGLGGSGGSVVMAAKCGISWSEVASCDECMNTSCCTELRGCIPGTACGRFLDCVSSNCAAGDTNCVQSQCGAEIQAAASTLSSLTDCNTQNCQGCE